MTVARRGLRVGGPLASASWTRADYQQPLRDPIDPLSGFLAGPVRVFVAYRGADVVCRCNSRIRPRHAARLVSRW